MKWESFDTFNDIIKDYMPEYGEGETLASQTVTDVNKLNTSVTANMSGKITKHGKKMKCD